MFAFSCNNKNRASFSTNSAEVRSNTKSQSFALDKDRNRRLDILIVIDSSTSMDDEHRFLETGLEPLLSAIEGNDWIIAVTTSEPFKCFLDRIITPTSDPAAFGQLIRDAIANNENATTGMEQMVLSTIKALRGECLLNDFGGIHGQDKQFREGAQDGGELLFTRCAEKKPWLRNGSNLVILMMSDEDNQYASDRIGGKLTDLYFYIESIRKIRSTAHVYGLFKPSASTNWSAWKDNDGESLFRMVEDICEACSQDESNKQYRKVVEDISKDVSLNLNKNFTLDYQHDGEESKVVLYYGDGESKELKLDVDYKIDGKTLLLISNLPANPKKISVEYSYNPDAS